jgi:hypothetical protein
MFALLCFILAVLASPFKSKIRLEAENVALRHQLIVLRRKVQGRVRPTKRPLVFYLSASLLGQLPQETSTAVQSTALAWISHTILVRWTDYGGDLLPFQTVVLHRGAGRRDQGWRFSDAAVTAKKGSR